MPNPAPLMVIVCVCCGRIPLTDVIVGGPFATFNPVLDGDNKFNAGERFEFKLSEAVSVSPVSAAKKTRLPNEADPDESATEFVPVSDNPPSASVIVTMLSADANAAPLSVNVTTGPGESGLPLNALVGGSVVKLSA